MGLKEIRELKAKALLPKEKKTHRLNHFSPKRAKENPVYLKLREQFLKDNPKCVVFGTRATQVHHGKGRVGKNYLDVSTWLPVSDKGHKVIELNPKWAKQNGYSKSRLT